MIFYIGGILKLLSKKEFLSFKYSLFLSQDAE